MPPCSSLAVLPVSLPTNSLSDRLLSGDSQSLPPRRGPSFSFQAAATAGRDETRQRLLHTLQDVLDMIDEDCVEFEQQQPSARVNRAAVLTENDGNGDGGDDSKSSRTLTRQ